MINLVNKLQTGNHPCFFVSSNLDDAVGMLNSLRDSKLNITYVNAFTFHGDSSSAKIVRNKTQGKEKKLHTDGQKENHRANRNYHDLVQGRVSHHDEHLIQSVGKYLLNLYITHKRAFFFVPIGIGSEVDHLIIKEAALRWLPLDRVIFWLDKPRTLRLNGEPPQVKKFLLKSFQCAQEHFYTIDFSQLAPKRIGNYYLTQIVASTPGQGEYQFALYTSKSGKQAYAKILPRYASRLARKWFENEVYAYQHIIKTSFEAEVSVPSLIKIGNHLGHKHILLEKIKGKHLLDMSTAKKINSYQSIIKFLSQIPTNNVFGIVKRGPLYWLGIMPLVVAKALFFESAHRKEIFYAYLQILRSAFVMLTRFERRIVHRDLNYDNAILREGKIYLIDFQLACIADPLLEYAVLYLKLYQDREFIKKFHSIIYKQAISGNPRRETVFVAYLRIICLYELAIHSQEPELAIKCLANLRRNK